jgi:hypothetical protein
MSKENNRYRHAKTVHTMSVSLTDYLATLNKY